MSSVSHPDAVHEPGGKSTANVHLDRSDKRDTDGQPKAQPEGESQGEEPYRFQRGFRFWAIIASLSVTSLQGSLENSVVVTSGPFIVDDLKMGEEYVWITNAFFLCCAAVQPLFGQLCNIFGRRWLMISATALFTLGCGICGGATGGAILIVGRGIQGVGSGDIIIADLVPLRERGYYLALLMISYTVGMTTGPIIGGAVVDNSPWRWVFYLNLPIGGVALVLLYLFVRVNYDKEMSLRQKLQRVDWVGNGLLMTGTIAILYALTYAGIGNSWTSLRTLVPLLTGLLAMVLFGLWEVYGFTSEPVIPPRLFRHRTSKIVAINTFLHWMLTYWAMYFLPIFLQVVLLFSAKRTGISLLPMALISIPSCAAAAVLVSHFGKFKALHLIGEVIFTVAFGLFSVQGLQTPTAQWATFQSIGSLGGGIVLETLLPAFQAPVPEEDQAAATATWAFIRTIGGVWGVAIPAAIMNNRIGSLADTISDPVARQLLRDGGAYQYASAAFVSSFSEPLATEIRTVYMEALKFLFYVASGFGGLASLLFMLEKDVPLRQHLKTNNGLTEDAGKETRVTAARSSDGLTATADRGRVDHAI